MAFVKRFINTSDIAAFIGQNKYDFVTPFERLWKRYDPYGYELALSTVQNQVETLNVDLANLEMQKRQLDEDLENKRITKRQHTTQTKRLVETTNQFTEQKSVLVDRIDDIQLTQQQKLEKTIGSEIVKEIQNEKGDISSKKSLAQTALENLNISAQKRNAIKKHAESFVNKTHGTLSEADAIALFEEKHSVKLDVSQQFHKKELLTNNNAESGIWWIGGKMDGIYIDPENNANSYIVEVKSRTNSFFSNLRDYEKTQIQTYMWLLDVPKAKLVERLRNKIRITNIDRDLEYMSDVIEYLQIFVNNFENTFLTSDTMKCKYVSLDADLKKQFLKDLYLNQISARLTEKINKMIEMECEAENDQCDIHSDGL